MLKKQETTLETSKEDQFFHPNRKFSISSHVENIIINLMYETEEEYNCCSDLQIFGDTSREDSKNVEGNNVNDDCEWYQAKTSIAGFKDCYVGKVSASDLW